MAKAKNEGNGAKLPPVADDAGFEVLRVITLPVFTFDNAEGEHGEAAGARKGSTSTPLYVRVDSVIFEGQEVKNRKRGAPTMGKALLVNVTDMQSGELGQLIVNTVMERVWRENYPTASYVGKGFQIIRHAYNTDGRYYNYSMKEVRVPEKMKPAAPDNHEEAPERGGREEKEPQRAVAGARQRKGTSAADGSEGIQA